MKPMPRRHFTGSIRAAAVALAALALAASEAAAQSVVNLIAAPTTKSVSLPDGTSAAVPMWGFALDGGTLGVLDGTDMVTVPGPRITVPPGDTTLTINLKNLLPENVSIMIPGQQASGAPVRDGVRIVSMAPEAAATGGTASYTFQNLAPGTYLYHSASHPAVQVQMGLYGAVTKDAAAGLAYPDDATVADDTSVPYTHEALLLYSEIDVALHQAVSNGTYGNAAAGGPTSTIDYAPALFLLNGESYTGASAPIAGGTAGQRTLIRMLNAGLKSHAVVVDNASMAVVAEDGNPYRDRRHLASVSLPAGKTHDAIWVPTAAGDFAVYDRTLHLVAGGYPLAGMLAKLRVAAAAGGDPVVRALPDSYLGVGVPTNTIAPISPGPLSEDTAGVVIGNVLTNDLPAGAGLTAELFASAGAGTVTLAPDGTFTYLPSPNFSGVDSFFYRAVSGSGPSAVRSAPAEVVLGVVPVPDAPTAFGLAVGLTYGETRPITLSGSDPDGDPLSFQITGPLPATGTLSITDATAMTGRRNLTAADVNLTAIPGGTLFYTPNAALSTGGTSPFTFRATDGALFSAPATVTVTVRPVESTAVADLPPLSLTVVGSDGASVADYYWTLEEDRTFDVQNGELNPIPRTGRDTLSVSFHHSYMPVVSTGDDSAPPQVDPTKRYFVSILPKNGTHTNGGGRVAAGQTAVQIVVNKTPIPTGKLRVQVFLDNGSLNGIYNNVEPGLAGFAVMLEDTAAVAQRGHQAAQQLTDAFGNPLGTTYRPCDDPETPAVETGCTDYQVKALGPGYLLTDATGFATFENLAPGLYEVFAVPPPGSNYVQGIKTVEGGKAIEAWVKANEPPYFHEFGPPGPHVIIGFVELTNNTQFLCSGPAPGCFNQGPVSTITGQVTNMHMSRPPATGLFSGAPFDFTQPYVALQYGAGEYGQVVYLQPTDSEGNFTIENVPYGSYRLWHFDSATNFIPGVKTINVNTPVMNLGDVPKFQWFSRSYQYVFEDLNQDGFRQAGERGIPEQATNLRFRDGTIYKSFPTDVNGFVPYEEIFPWFNWLVAEVDYTRFKATGATVVVDGGGCVQQATCPATPLANTNWPEQVNADIDSRILAPQPQSENGGAPFRTETGPVLLEGFQGFLGQSHVILWGKAPYAAPVPDPVTGVIPVDVNVAPFDDFPGPGDTDLPTPTQPGGNGKFDFDAHNGGITGIAHYSTTRAENLARWGTPEFWEPGIAGVRVQLWDQTRTVLLNEATTDSWDAALPEGCQGDVYLYLGRPTDCFDGMRNFNQVRPAVFDGGYAFYTQKEPFVTAAGAIVPIDQRTTERPLPAGKYVVKVIVPRGYKLVKEEDKNVDFGEEYIPQEFWVTGYDLGDAGGTTAAASAPRQHNDNLITPFCVGALHTVPAQLSLFPGVETTFAGDEIPLCDEKLIVLRNGQNATGNFFLFTEAPIAGKLAGMVLDDTAIEFDPNAPQFGEKFALAWMPIAIKDFTGREIARTMTDRNGVYNAMVPSTFTSDRPAPDGYAPAMLQACINPPLMPGAGGAMVPDPLHNKRYSTWCFPFQYMPGTTTYMDTPVVPTGAFSGQPGLLTMDAELPNLTPIVHSVTGPGRAAVGTVPAIPTGPYVVTGIGAAARLITITSAGNMLVPNPAYANPGLVSDTPSPAVPKEITRDYGFGTIAGQVLLNDTPLAIVSWTNAQITATVPNAAVTGQLRVVRCLASPCTTAANRRESVGGVTLTVATTAFHTARPPKTVAAGGSIQALIDSPTTEPGDLILVPPGTYEELIVMNKPVRLQGWGSRSTIISAVKSPTEKLEQWRDKVKAMIYANQTLPADIYLPSPPNPPGTVDPFFDLDILTPSTGSYLLAYQFDLLIASLLTTERFDGLPDPNEVPKLGDALGDLPVEILAILFGGEGGFGVFGKYLPVNGAACPVTPRPTGIGDPLRFGFGLMRENGVFATPTSEPTGGQIRPNARIDGFSITGSDGASGIEINGNACDLAISNNYIYNNNGYDAGGIKVGHIGVLAGQGDEPANNDRIAISHNVITQNGSVLAHPAADYKGAGGIGIGSGAPGYRVNHNFIAGNFTGGNGAGIGHTGLSSGGTIDHNTLVFNESFNQTVTRSGGGIFVGGRPAASADSLPAAVGDPRGFYVFPPHLPGPTPGSGHVTIANNLIQGNSAASGDGGGIGMAQVNGRDVAPGRYQFLIDGAEVDDPLLVFVWNASEQIIAAAAGAPDWAGGWRVNVFGNTIVNNVAGLAGAGIALQDAIDVQIIHNTVARNDSLAVAGEAFELRANQTDPFLTVPQPAGIIGRQHGGGGVGADGQPVGLRGLLDTLPGTRPTFSNPRIVNSIVWQNRSFFFGPVAGGIVNPQDPNPTAYGLIPRGTGNAQYWDLGVLGAPATATLAPTFSVLTNLDAANGTNGGSNNVTTTPSFASAYTNGDRRTRLDLVEIENRILTPIALDEGGNFIRPYYGPLTLHNPATGALYGNYRLINAAGMNGQFLEGVGGIYPTLAAVPLSLTADAEGDPRVPRTAVTPHRGADQYFPATAPPLPPPSSGSSLLGLTTVGPSTDGFNANFMNGSIVTTTAATTLNSISVFVAGAAAAAANRPYSVAIYSNIVVSGTNRPGLLIASSATGTLAANTGGLSGWNTMPVTASLAAGTSYWLMYNTRDESTGSQNVNLNNMRYESAPLGTSVYAERVFGTWPNTFPTLADPGLQRQALRFSLFATVTP